MGRLGLPGLGLLARHNVRGPITPKDLISGVIVQLDPDDPRNEVIGLGLDRFKNQVTGGIDARQTVNARRPELLIGGGMNGHNGAHFDRANTEFMDLTGLTAAAGGRTVFAVVDHLSIPANSYIFHADLSGFASYMATAAFNVGILSPAPVDAQAAMTGEQMLTWRINGGTTTFDCFRDGVLLHSGVGPGDLSLVIGGNVSLGTHGLGIGNCMDAILSYFLIVDHVTTTAETALVHAWLADRFAITADLNSIANLGAWWDLDYSTQAGGILTGLTDLALADTLNIVGSPAIVPIGGKDYVRMDGTDDVIWMADKAALDGGTGCTHILKHANHEALPVIAALCLKARAGIHINGGLWGNASVGTRLTAYLNSADVPNAGPLAEFSTPGETIACAIESGAAIRRVDGDGTYASTATAHTTTVGVGSLHWGARESGAGPVFDRYLEVDLRKAAYYNRPLNQYELIAAHALMDASP